MLRKRCSKLKTGLLLAAAMNVLMVPPAFAYVDPGTGTMVLQIAGAIIAAGLFYLGNLRSWLVRRFRMTKPAQLPEPAAETKDTHGK